jgi:hypothetical protein
MSAFCFAPIYDEMGASVDPGTVVLNRRLTLGVAGLLALSVIFHRITTAAAQAPCCGDAPRGQSQAMVAA